MSDARTLLLGDRLSLRELASTLGCSVGTIYNYMRRGLPYVVVAGQRYINPKDFRAMIERDERNTAPRRAGRPRIHAPGD